MGGFAGEWMGGQRNRCQTLSSYGSQVRAMVFPVVMYECESWTLKKAER